eukprot:1743789-Alexandrium_andersonii.AAC.1
MRPRRSRQSARGPRRPRRCCSASRRARRGRSWTHRPPRGVDAQSTSGIGSTTLRRASCRRPLCSSRTRASAISAAGAGLLGAP